MYPAGTVDSMAAASVYHLGQGTAASRARVNQARSGEISRANVAHFSLQSPIGQGARVRQLEENHCCVFVLIAFQKSFEECFPDFSA